MPTGLVPEQLFNPQRWKEEDKLWGQQLIGEIKDPEGFFSKVCLLQEREREAKSPKSANFQALLDVYRERSDVMKIIKHPHFCHQKTKLSLIALYWAMGLSDNGT